MQMLLKRYAERIKPRSGQVSIQHPVQRSVGLLKVGCFGPIRPSPGQQSVKILWPVRQQRSRPFGQQNGTRQAMKICRLSWPSVPWIGKEWAKKLDQSQPVQNAPRLARLPTFLDAQLQVRMEFDQRFCCRRRGCPRQILATQPTNRQTTQNPLSLPARRALVHQLRAMSNACAA
jgi:hypothetical protein